MGACAAAGGGAEPQREVVEGVVRALAHHAASDPAGPGAARARAAVCTLARPLLATCAAACAADAAAAAADPADTTGPGASGPRGGGGSGGAEGAPDMAAAAAAVGLLAHAVHFLDLPLPPAAHGGAAAHIAAPLLGDLLPLLAALARGRRTAADPAVVAATFRCLGEVSARIAARRPPPAVFRSLYGRMFYFQHRFGRR